MYDFSEIEKIDPEVAASINDELNRGGGGGGVIASENIASKEVNTGNGH